MASKSRTKTATKETEVPVPVVSADQAVQFDTRCLAWCFLPGVSHIGQSGLLQCTLLDGHEEEHKIRIEVLSPPSGAFTITWTTGQ